MLCNKAILEKCQDEILQAILYAENNRMTMIWDEYDEVLLVTKLIERHFAVKVEEVLGQSWTLIYPNHLIKEIKTHFEQASEKLVIPHQVISSIDSKFSYFSITIEKVNTKKESFYVCTMQDITETQLLKNTICKLEKESLAARLSANIVHEIRNPLTAIKGFLQLIEAGIDHREQYISVLLSEIEKAEGLTNELLQMANPYKKKKIVNINELLTDVIVLMQAQTEMRNIEIEVSGECDVAVFCNPTEIKQVLINLILNGADAMDHRGTIKVNVKCLEDSVAIEVIDHGHGMSEQILEKINNEFYTTKENGTGLGLVVIEQILENHRGQLSIFSMENVGSTFEITLPI